MDGEGTREIHPPSQDILDFARRSTRQLLENSRRAHRYEANDHLRAVSTPNMSKEAVAQISNKLKSSVTADELRQLKNAILDDTSNIKTILEHYGALRGLAREISGNDVEKQVEAAGCCCNLALGSERDCVSVARTAGPYLAMHLSSMSEELAVTCAWALGTAAGGGRRAAGALGGASGAAGGAAGAGAGAVGALARGLSGAGGRAAAALYALEHITFQLGDTLDPKLHRQLVSAALSCKHADVWRLLFILSTHPNFKDFEHDLSQVMSAIYVSMETHSKCEDNKCCDILYRIRYWANLCVDAETCDFFIQRCLSDTKCHSFHRILKDTNSELNLAMMWLLGNILAYATVSDIKKRFFDSVFVD